MLNDNQTIPNKLNFNFLHKNEEINDVYMPDALKDVDSSGN